MNTYYDRSNCQTCAEQAASEVRLGAVLLVSDVARLGFRGEEEPGRAPGEPIPGQLRLGGELRDFHNQQIH